MLSHPAFHVRRGVRSRLARHQALVNDPEDHCVELWGGRAGRHSEGSSRGSGLSGHCPGSGIRCLPRSLRRQ
eukprot:9578294-Alexandrium_andersonii.AAC.1